MPRNRQQMIHEISLENFKPFGAAHVVPLKKITLIYGPNSSGKSSLIQALMLLRQSINPATSSIDSLAPRGKYVDLGSFRSILHRHETKRLLSIGIAFDSRDRFNSRNQYVSSVGKEGYSSIGLSYRSTRSHGSRRMDTSELVAARYRIGHGPDVDATASSERLNVGLVKEEHSEREKLSFGYPRFQWDSPQSSLSYLEYLQTMTGDARGHATKQSIKTHTDLLKRLRRASFLEFRGLPSRLDMSERSTAIFSRRFGHHVIMQPLGELIYRFSSELSRLSYLGPLRSYPERHYLVSAEETQSVGSRGEHTPHIIFRNRSHIESVINYWFSRFEISYKIKAMSIGDDVTGELIALKLFDRNTRVHVSPSDVGFGVGQLLPIVVEAVVGNRRTICVEQPEIHLHPRLQAHLADLLIDTSGVASRNGPAPTQGNQWIVETHSEALLLRLQRRIREGKVRSEDVSVLYVQPLGLAGSRILNLRLDHDGEFIDEWPGGFFEDSYHELVGGNR